MLHWSLHTVYSISLLHLDLLFIVFYVSFLVFFLDFVFTHATLVIADSIQYFSSSSVFIIYCILCHFSSFLDFVFTHYIGNGRQYTVFLFIWIYYLLYFMCHFSSFFLDFVFARATLVIADSIQYFSSSSGFIILCILCVISLLFSRFCIYTCYIGHCRQYTVFLFFIWIY